MNLFRLKKFNKSQKGQGVVEMALALPILIMVVFSIFEFGRYFFCIHNLKYAVNEGGKVAILRSSPAKITQKIQNAAKAFGIKSDAVTVKYYLGSSLNSITEEVDYTVVNNSEILFTNPEKDTFCRIFLKYDFTPIAPYPLITNDNGTVIINVENYVKIQM